MTYAHTARWAWSSCVYVACSFSARRPRYQTAAQLGTDLRRWLEGQFGKEQAAAELKKLKADAGAVRVDLEWQRTDDTASA